MPKILIVDDEPAMVEVITALCRTLGVETIPAPDGTLAIELLSRHQPDIVIADLKMEPVGGLDVLRAARQQNLNVAVIVITAYGSLSTAVEAMRIGAFDYITKPFKMDELQLAIEKAITFQTAILENIHLKHELRDKYRFENIIGTSAAIEKLFALMRKIVATESTTLIQGESGTGKELVARAIHYNSLRHSKPFVAVNCGALPENLLESELFGHKRGSFTGAVSDKIGLFQEADGGTLFLDEINALPLALQSKLLRALQEREIRPVGDTKNRPVNVRVLAASNESLDLKTRAGHFREDLFYRLNVITLEIPPLRERKDDLPLLIQHFLQKLSKQNRHPLKRLSSAALELLKNYHFPGNVRELENALERGAALCDGAVIQAEDLPPHFTTTPSVPILGSTNDNSGHPVLLSLADFSEKAEKQYVLRVIDLCDGNKLVAAEKLQIGIATLYRKIGEK